MTIYMDVAQQLLECYRAELGAVDFPNPPPDENICLRHGEQVAPTLGTGSDECCAGLAWVRVATAEPLRDAGDGGNRCVTSERRVTLEMGAAHCMPWGTTEAGPTCEQWTAVTLQADAYHGAMERALCCLRTTLSRDEAEVITPGAYAPFGPDANCVGGIMQVIVETSCGCGTGG